MKSSRRTLQAPLTTYFAERLVIDPTIAREEWSGGAAIYGDYVAWCEEVGNKPLSTITFGRELRVRLTVDRAECRRPNGVHYPVRLQCGRR